MTKINYVEPNVLCSLFYLNLPLEIVQNLYSEYITDYKQKIKIIFKTYNKYKYLSIFYDNLNLYKTYEYCKYLYIITGSPEIKRNVDNCFKWMFDVIDINSYKLKNSYIDYYYLYDIDFRLKRLKWKNDKKLMKYKKKQEKINNKNNKRNTYYQTKTKLKLKNYY